MKKTLGALLIGVSGLLLSPAPAQATSPDGLYLVSDFGTGRLRLMDPLTNSIVYDYIFENQSSEKCLHPRVTCGAIGGRYVNQGGEDYLDMALFVYNAQPGTPKVDRYYSVIQRVKPNSQGSVAWKLKAMDFRHLPNGPAYCVQDSVEPTITEDPRCRGRLVHSIQVVDDRPSEQTVSVLMADMFNNRVIQATLNYANGNTVGKVDWVLTSDNPDWPLGGATNSAQLITDQPGGPYLLVTFYSATEVQDYGGLMIMYQWENGAWRARWRFPEENPAFASSLLQTPHMGEFMMDPATGEPIVLYSHSRGTAGSWGTYSDYGGSFGLLRLGDTLADTPSYVHDAVVHGDDPARETKFSRDVDFLPDGSMLLTDAACESGACANPSRLFRVTPYYHDRPLSSEDGAYWPDESRIERYSIPDTYILDDIQCGFGVLFEAEFIPASRLGRTLSAARKSPVGACPAPTL